jgi:hypothetical protein
MSLLKSAVQGVVAMEDLEPVTTLAPVALEAATTLEVVVVLDGEAWDVVALDSMDSDVVDWAGEPLHLVLVSLGLELAASSQGKYTPLFPQSGSLAFSFQHHFFYHTRLYNHPLYDATL